MATAELRVEMAGDDIAFLEAYAARHDVTLPDLLARYVTVLRAAPQRPPHPAHVPILGIIPGEVEGREAYRDYLSEKHR